MKLQVLKIGQEGISGYDQVVVNQPDNLELSHVIDNSCEIILASDILDLFHPRNTLAVLQSLSSKLRLGGYLIVGGTDVRLFAKSVMNGLLTDIEASSVSSETYAMSSMEFVKEMLLKLNLKIFSVHIDGLHYEIKVVRKNGL